MAPPNPRTTLLALALLVVAATFAIYAPVAHHGFVAYDDDLYVTANPMVLRGLSADGLRWAFTTDHATNWHPLTWLSHMLDVELFGTDAGIHHLVGVSLHALNGVLLLLALRALGISLGVAGFAALAFAVHPLRVESVAWASERKDLLGGLGWMLSLLAYARYARRPSVGGMGLLAGALTLGLLAKPMLVTLPIVLWLLDRWPLERTASAARRLLEKLPLTLPVLASCALTLWAQSRAVRDLDALPFDARLSNAFVATATYVWQTLLPHGLAFFHPHPALVEGASYEPWRPSALLAAAFVCGLSLTAWRLRGRAAWLTTGWFWFLVGLLPVLGLVQVGAQAWAERYAYLPTIGLYLVLASGARVALKKLAPRHGSLIGCVAAAAVLAAWATRAREQVHVWKDSRTLFAHAVDVTERNWVAHNLLGLQLVEAGELGEGLAQYELALAARPGATRPLYNAALVHLRRGELERAAKRLEEALASSPGFAAAHATLGIVQGRLGLFAEARRSFERALTLDPTDAATHANLGSLLVVLGDDRDALRHLRRALSLDPDRSKAAERLAWALATSPSEELREPREALRVAREVAAGSDDPLTLATLAAALAANGAFDEAVRWQRSALEGAPPALREELRSRLTLYEGGRPFVREPR